MPINFTCPHCGIHTEVADHFAGQQGPCKGCGNTITIPAAQIPRPKSSSGLPVVLVVLIVTVVALLCMVGGVTALLLPALHSARDAAHRTSCANNVKQIGLAMHHYYLEHDSFPPAYLPDENGQPMHSWRVLLLPFLEQQHLYEQYDFSKPWDAPENSELADRMPDIYGCPTDSDADDNETDYVVVTGPGTVFEGAKRVSFPQIRDGRSNTIMLVEVSDSFINWLEPTDVTVAELIRHSSNHNGGYNAGFCDGSVKFIPDTLDISQLRDMSTISGEETAESW